MFLPSTIYAFLAGLLVLLHLLPLTSEKHWFFRIWDFGRIQLCYLQLVVLIFGLFLILSGHPEFLIVQLLLLASFVHNVFTLIKYTPYFKSKASEGGDPKHSEEISLISINVHQFNKDYGQLISLVKKESPHIVFTMESNSKWQEALAELEDHYPVSHKVPLENTYGMHLYTRLNSTKIKTHFFVSDDIPSIEAHLQTNDGYNFVFWGVHPPPPSPTEQKNSRERDGELMSIAKVVRISTEPTVVVGDFNTVAWSRISVLFKKVSQLMDPRMGRGIISTYPAAFKILRCPIDLIFHNHLVKVSDLHALPSIGSDHLPLFCLFSVQKGSVLSAKEAPEIERNVIDRNIREGKKEEGNRPNEAKPGIGDLIK